MDNPGKGDSNANLTISTATTSHASPDGDDADLPIRPKPIAGSSQQDHNFAKVKWERLSALYKDEYLDIFNESQAIGDSDEPVETSQFGSVTWTSVEKACFFDALARKGRHDLPALAKGIGTKSILEVKDYLQQLNAAFQERQIYARHAKSVSPTEMEAAIEISPELEELLEGPAEALAAFQDYYDLSKAQSKTGDRPGIVNAELAALLQDQYEADQDDSGHEVDLFETRSQDLSNRALQLFRLDNWIELGTTLFMNASERSQNNHWTAFAEPGEQPSIAINAVDAFYSLVKIHVQRILQTALFLAESRLRSTSTSTYAPARVLKDIDVHAALRTLDMPSDHSGFWYEYLTRSQVEIVLGGHSKGYSTPISLEKAQQVLSAKDSHDRHLSLDSMLVVETDADSSSENGDAVEASMGDVISSPQANNSDNHEMELDASFDDDSYASADSQVDESMSENSFSDLAEISETAEQRANGPANIHMSRKRRRILLDDSEEKLLESLDADARKREETRLRFVLGLPEGTPLAEREYVRRPKRPRKSQEDLKDWIEHISYRAGWEQEATYLSLSITPDALDKAYGETNREAPPETRM